MRLSNKFVSQLDPHTNCPKTTIVKQTIGMGLLLTCIVIYFFSRTQDEFYWSGWGFGDAQTMLTLHHWQEEGWVTNKFLAIPQGYAKVTRFFDEPRLRHHSHGISPGVSPRIGPRLWYTHYPSGYLIPYAILFRLGIRHIFFLRMLSLLFSIGALTFMYILFSQIISPAVSFLAVFFYAISPPFIRYAASIANQPIDDLLRFAFMLLIVLSTSTTVMKERKAWLVSAWIIGFLLSLVSLDSIFFIYFWLIGWDLLERRRFRWRTYLIFAQAPLLAYFLKFLQNVWYLGLGDASTDIKDTFLIRGLFIRDKNIFITLQFLFKRIFNAEYFKLVFNEPAERLSLVLIALFSLFYALYFNFIKSKEKTRLPSLKLLAVLFLCGLSFFLIFPSTAIVSTYQARQMMPFMALLVSANIWAFGSKLWFKKKVAGLCFFMLVFLIGIVSVIKIDIGKTNYYIHPYKHKPQILLAKAIKAMVTKYEPVIFNLDGFRWYWTDYIPGYPQIHPILEYYAGARPILCFSTSQQLTSDLLYLAYRSPYKFSPILVTKNLAQSEEIFSLLSKDGALNQRPTALFVIDRYITDLSDYLEWDYIKAILRQRANPPLSSIKKYL